jgi:antitoxin component HigA of HigAB toxin-antitoxin module
MEFICRQTKSLTAQPPASTPVEVLKFVMEQHGPRAADLAARRLADRFRLSVEAFI